MKTYYKYTDAVGVIQRLQVQLTYDEIVELLIDGGAVPEGMTVEHWNAGLELVTLDLERSPCLSTTKTQKALGAETPSPVKNGTKE